MPRNLLENITGIQHIGLPTLDMDATIKFYSFWDSKYVNQKIMLEINVIF
jgi:hypothetical protein